MNDWPYESLRPATAAVVLVVLLAWESLAPFLRLFTGGDRLRHGVRNFALSLVNAGATALFSTALWLAAAGWAEGRNVGLLHWLDWPAPARLAAAFLGFDLWMYWWHRLNHRVPFLWRFHRTHHSDPAMDVTTAGRFHPGEILLSSLLRVPVIVLLGLHLWELAAYELAMFTVVQVHHANIAFPPWLERMLRLVIVTPQMHKVHHSRWQPETDSNYASLFSWWDRVFRSFRLRADPHAIRFGLDDFDQPRDQSVGGLLATPWRRVAERPQPTPPPGPPAP